MTPEEMKRKSSEKVEQIAGLMKVLNIRAEAKQIVNKQGIIECVVFYIDDEEYPQVEKPESNDTQNETA